jgi:nucleolar protein 6
MAKSSKKRQRTSDEDAADDHDAAPIVKKNKLDSAGKAKATKKGSKTKEPGFEPPLADGASEPKPEKKEKKEKKKDKKDKKDKTGKKEKKDKMKKKSEKEQNKHTEAETEPGTTNLAIRTAPEAAAAASEDTSERPQAQDSETHKGSDSKSRDDDKSKEKKKKNKEKKEKTKQTATQQSTPQDDEDTITGGEGKQTRFICFVGNLPFTASRAAVERHFSSLSPISVRLLTQRDDPSKSRGIAFVEFGRYDHMKTCLAKFHHTEFDDGISPPRRINVELTYAYFPFPRSPFLFIHSLMSV